MDHHTSFLHQSTTDFATEISAHPPSESTKDFLITIKSFMIALNGSFSQHHNPIDFVEADLHHIWYMVIEVARISEPDDTTHDSLVILLSYFRELGTLRRAIEGVEEDAVVSGGRVWSDLPFFGSDLLAAWEQSKGMSPKQRANLAMFTGKCVALVVGDGDVLLSALGLLDKALEKPQKPTGSKEDDGVPIVELLPACTALFRECGHKLLTLCISNQKIGDNDMPLSSSGQGATHKSFSIERWLSWRKRLQDLSQSKDEVLAKEAKCGFDTMINCGREMGYDVQGEEKYWAKVMDLLADELKRSGKESVGLEDIVTDPSWVD